MFIKQRKTDVPASLEESEALESPSFYPLRLFPPPTTASHLIHASHLNYLPDPSRHLVCHLSSKSSSIKY